MNPEVGDLDTLPHIFDRIRGASSVLVKYKGKMFQVKPAGFEAGAYVAFDGKGMCLYIEPRIANTKLWALASPKTSDSSP